MSGQNIAVSNPKAAELLASPQKKRRFATAIENDDPNRVIGIEEYAEIVGVSVSSIRRWLNSNDPYYDPRLIVRNHKKGAPYRWLRSDAALFRSLLLGVVPEA